MSISLLLVGFVVGMGHALEADHVASMATIAGKPSNLSQRIKMGAAWGLGHTLMLLLCAGTALALGKVIPESFAGFLEMLVGVMLLILAADVLRRARHKAEVTSHQYHSLLRALNIGLLHGMAGSAALILLSLQHTPDVSLAVIYVLVFGVGSLLGMVLLSMGMLLPFFFVGPLRFERWYTPLQYCLGTLAVVVGLIKLLSFL